VVVGVVKASAAAAAVARASDGAVTAEGVKAAKAVVREEGRVSAAEEARAGRRWIGETDAACSHRRRRLMTLL